MPACNERACPSCQSAQKTERRRHAGQLLLDLPTGYDDHLIEAPVKQRLDGECMSARPPTGANASTPL